MAKLRIYTVICPALEIVVPITLIRTNTASMPHPLPVAPAPEVRSYTVSVRALCEFTAKQGDLDLRFTPSPSALEGIAGHTAVTSRRPVHYQREVALSGAYRHLQVRGRADGYDPQRQRLEEIKTHRSDLALQPSNHRFLHWAQAKVYAWLSCELLGLAQIDVVLVYFDILSQQETELVERHSAPALQQFFAVLCERFLHWADQELAHRTARDLALMQLQFPHEDFRAGQRALAEAVYRANSGRRCLLAQAPTGIGKTMATLFPALKACPGQRLDKLFYLTAKTPGRQLALDAMRRIQVQADAPPLRVLELVARDKACEHPDLACHGESCPLAKGFYDRLPAARQAALSTPILDRQGLREIALAHDVCPYYLGQEMLRWSDVVVGDYNHFLDLNAQLYRLTVSEGWKVSLLLDEAHNLVERCRQMYTAELEQNEWRWLRQDVPAGLKKPLDRVQRQWNALLKDHHEAYRVHDGLPGKFIDALQHWVQEVGAHQAEHPGAMSAELQRCFFAAAHFLRVAELHGAHALFDISREPGRKISSCRLCLRNVVPAPLIKDRWAATHSVTLFSATLSPPNYVLDLLGLPESTVWLDLPSPFDPGRLRVHVASQLSTRYADRKASLPGLVQLMADQYRQQPGNYLAFFSSFDYLRSAAALLAETHSGIELWQQERGMDEVQREAFLARFVVGGKGIAFAVLGGAFGEGIDLPGTRLCGAFIATLGLPQINPVNEQISRCMQDLLGHGYDYTYLYPGLQKVVQAAGRVIRTPQDQGVLYLMDDRFDGARIRRLLPPAWNCH
jgi:Rad3-related DNA helicase